MHIGFDSYVPFWQVVALINPVGLAAKKIRDTARLEGRLLDSTHSRRTRSMVVTATNQVVLSSVSTETLIGRLEAKRIEEDLRLRTINQKEEVV